MLLFSLAMLAGSAILLTGCGQKGALYLPQEKVDNKATEAVKSDTKKKANQN
ncbi:MAG: lipoprotein [Gammaproteobacteria bacterium]|nr:lipoprotein [Gammaproteobacteria bacterium]MDH5776591.1 lipoprotein [Gammaproteobacteria bacterium]